MSEKTSVALGLFDGVHRGHRKVLELALKYAENGCKPAVFTFSPQIVLKKSTGADGYIYTDREKLRIWGLTAFILRISAMYADFREKNLQGIFLQAE